MTDQEIMLAAGGLLHDIGKVIYRQKEDKRTFSQSGHDYLVEEAGVQDPVLLNCVRYHHADQLQNADIAADDFAYIVHIADNIASAADRRQSNCGEKSFELQTPLQSVFNILNGNHENMFYRPMMLDPDGEINYPQDESVSFDASYYSKAKEQITANLKELEWSTDYINALMEVLELVLSYVPCEAAQDGISDVSLFDHVKLTAAFSVCIYQYLQEKNSRDYKDILFLHKADFYKEKAFQLFSMDVSGIQTFIYTITSKRALRMLRSRSFYLEIMMENLMDTLLDNLGLTRANLIYAGGGHCYILIPNTEFARQTVADFLKDTRDWLLENFGTSLYVAGGCQECSSMDLNNEPAGSYSDIFRKLSEKISQIKMQRYSADDIRKLNGKKYSDYSRECTVCRNIGNVNADGVCPMCQAIIGLSEKILNKDYFSVIKEKRDGALPLSRDRYLTADTEESLADRKKDAGFIRVYGINKASIRAKTRSKLWVGNYASGDTFEELAQKAEGINRLGILRADVDNMGQAFVAGFNGEKGGHYATLSRTAAMSRQLSLFFKLQINKILANGEYHIKETGKEGLKRNAAIVYSGGDDLFIVGAWNEIIELSVDIRRQFARYVQNTLTISAGIGVYQSAYPISAMAYEVAELEEQSKKMPGKNAVSIFPDSQYHTETAEDESAHVKDSTYKWENFEQKVIQEKLRILDAFFDAFEIERGNSFLYHLLDLIRARDEKINMARYVYLLARLEPGSNEPEEKKAAYKEFAKNMYEWYQSEEDCRQLKTACIIHVYLNRETEE